MSAEPKLWGFCERCELWRCSDAWFAGGRIEPACPACGAAPRPLERFEDGQGRVLLTIELPPGGELPLLA